MAATSAMRSGFGTAQSAGTLMGGKETTSPDSLVAILASCSNMGGLQGEAAALFWSKFSIDLDQLRVLEAASFYDLLFFF
jgi:hypothetical protein